MSQPKRILVTGATGAEGGGVARHLLRAGRWAVRCLTRNPESERARALAAGGGEVVRGDLGDAASVRAAVAGCDGVFGVTNFWEHFGKEYEQGQRLVDCVAAAGVEHFIFSTHPYAGKLTGGELEVPHFDAKGRLEEYIRSLNLGATFVSVAFYYENFLSYFPPQKQADGSLAFGFPQGDTPLAAVAVEDTGGVVAALFARGGEFRNQVVGVVGDDRPPVEYAEIMTRVLGKPITYRHIGRDAFAALGFPGAADLANMFDFTRRFVPDRQADLELSRSLYPGIQTFEGWLSTNKAGFSLFQA